MPPHPIWSGTISFGLVSIPVRMLTATSSRELRFPFVDRRDLEPIGYDKVRKDTGEHVDPDDIVRAFELEKGHFVPIEPEDLDRLDVELTHSVDTCDFVSPDEIDPIYSGRRITSCRRRVARSCTGSSSRRLTRPVASGSQRS
jgi:DNA end-binding protein Ku